MKKFLCMLLCVLLLGSLAAQAFAVTVVNGEVTEDGVVFDLPYNGLRLSFPPEFEDMKGVVYRTGDGKMQDRDLYYTNFLYFGLSPEEWEERMDLARRSQELTKEELERYEYLDGQDAFLPGFLCGKDESEVESFVQYSAELGAPFASVTKIGEANGYIYYCFEDEETRIEHLKPEYVEEYRKIVEAIKEAGTKAEFSVPTEPEDPWIGKVLQFETTDLDGNTVRSEDLFAEHDITMLNFWATWCENCLKELGDLSIINRRMQEENCAIVGIFCNLDEEEDMELGKALLEKNGVDYLNLIMPEVLSEAGIADYLPTSVFVDSSGTIISPVITGALVHLYEPRFRGLLDGAEPAEADAAAEPAEADAAADASEKNNSGSYRVIVNDQDGNPVKGVTVQFCSDVTCTLGKTDADGLASFEADEGQVYTVHVLKVPEGFEKNSEEFETLDTYSDTRIVLQKAA